MDAALETLFLPIHTGRITWPDDGALFLRARSGPAMLLRPLPGLLCEQTYKPDVDALRRDGFALATAEQRTFDIVLVLPPRQRERACDR